MNIQTVSPLEWWANGITALSVFLAAAGHILTWPIGIVGSVLFGALFLEAHLYADFTLQGFFIVTSLIGWHQWRKAGGPSQAARVHPLSGWRLIGMSLMAITVAIAYGGILHYWTDAFAPFWDSAILMGSVLAQILLMRGHHQTWPAWLVVNTLSVPLYLQRQLPITALLYTLFWFNACWGWWRWHRLSRITSQAR